MKRAIDRYVDSMLRRRRPKPFAPTQDEVAIARTVIGLTAADPEGQRPREEFVADLRRRLAESEGAEQSGSAARRLPSPGRRRVLAATALTATAAAGVVAGHELTRPGDGPPADESGQLTPTAGSWQDVAADADLPEGAVLPFDLGAVTGFVRKVSGRVQAVSGVCTHQGCRLALNPPRDQLACPCHGATFSLAGASLTHPHTSRPLPALPRLPVRVDQGRVQIYAPSPTGPGPSRDAAAPAAPTS